MELFRCRVGRKPVRVECIRSSSLHERLCQVGCADCPDCGLSLDLLSNDHVTVDCVSAVRNVLAVFAALEAWLMPMLLRADSRATNAFCLAWHWMLRPSRRRAYSIVAILLAGIAKQLLWSSFASRAFGGGESALAVSESASARVGTLVLDVDLIAVAKRELLATVRFALQRYPKLYRCLARFARHLV